MMLCEQSGCRNWAQWRVSEPERDSAGKILRLTTVALLCSPHEEVMKKSADPELDLRFNFVGAVPNGAANS